MVTTIKKNFLVVYRGCVLKKKKKLCQRPSTNGLDFLSRVPKKFGLLLNSEPWWLWSNYALGSRYWFFSSLLVHGCYKVPSYIFVDKYDQYLKLNNYHLKFK